MKPQVQKKLKVGYVPKKGETLYTKLCRLKQTVELEDWKDVVYAIGCETCGVHYMGETRQHYCDRRKQHQGMWRKKKLQMELMTIWKQWGTQGKLGESKPFGQGGQLEGKNDKESIYINCLNPTMKIDP